MVTENDSGLIVISGPPSREAFLVGFWRWVELLASGEHERASAALWRKPAPFWSRWFRSPPDPEALPQRIRTLWGGDQPWHVVVPNARIVGEVNNAAETSFPAKPPWGPGRVGWGLAHVPVTVEPARAKDDDVPLMGVAVSFFLREVPGGLAMEFEIVHV